MFRGPKKERGATIRGNAVWTFIELLDNIICTHCVVEWFILCDAQLGCHLIFFIYFLIFQNQSAVRNIKKHEKRKEKPNACVQYTYVLEMS